MTGMGNLMVPTDNTYRPSTYLSQKRRKYKISIWDEFLSSQRKRVRSCPLLDENSSTFYKSISRHESLNCAFAVASRFELGEIKIESNNRKKRKGKSSSSRYPF